jgi:hypothetical protein
MRLVCFECDPVEQIRTTGESITAPDGFVITTEEPSVFAMPRKLREVVKVEGNIATLSCQHTRSLWLRFSGEDYL